MTRPDGPPEQLTLPAFPFRHAFFTRRGGVSTGPFASLNLREGAGDEPDAVRENRRRAVAAFGTDPHRWVGVRQVHGRRVVAASEAGDDVEADAIVAVAPGWTLRVGAADCVPLLLGDPASGAVAAVHAGWRGAVAGIVEAAVERLGRDVGSDPSSMHAAVGPSISGPQYQVGPELVEAFADAGFPASIVAPDPHRADRWRLSVPEAVRFALQRAGLAQGRVHVGGWCTASDPERFYSHRRDRGVTGRHWAVVASAAPTRARPAVR